MVGVYFSGTGNTKYCVEKFIRENEKSANIISIEDLNVIEEIKNNEVIVFGYPIYFSNLPKIVREFIEVNRDSFKGKKIYIIATMGLFSGDGTGCSARLFKEYGAIILGGLHLKMPDCIGDEKILKKSKEQNLELINKATTKIEKAAKDFKSEIYTKEGLNIFYHFAGLFGQRLWFYKKTREYTDKAKVNESKCIRCRKCIKVCPMENLILVEDRIKTKKKCTMCYRCFSNCPTQAITILGKEVYEQCKLTNYIK